MLNAQVNLKPRHFPVGTIAHSVGVRESTYGV